MYLAVSGRPCKPKPSEHRSEVCGLPGSATGHVMQLSPRRAAPLRSQRPSAWRCKLRGGDNWRGPLGEDPRCAGAAIVQARWPSGLRRCVKVSSSAHVSRGRFLRSLRTWVRIPLSSERVFSYSLTPKLLRPEPWGKLGRGRVVVQEEQGPGGRRDSGP